MNIVNLISLPKEQVRAFLISRWGSTQMAAKGRLHDLERLSGAAAMDEGQIVGMVTFDMEEDGCKIVTLNSTVRQAGIGAALLKETERIAAGRGCTRVWGIATNDNTRAIRFFQKNGMSLCGFYRNAMEEARKLKPSIPLRGQDGIAIEHELEFEKRLDEVRHTRED